MNTVLLEKTEYGEVPVDVFSKLASDRILFLSDGINSKSAVDVAAALIYLDSIDNSKISLYINVDDAETRSTFGLFDTMKTIKSPIETFCTGYSDTMATLILSSRNKRFKIRC